MTRLTKIASGSLALLVFIAIPAFGLAHPDVRSARNRPSKTDPSITTAFGVRTAAASGQLAAQIRTRAKSDAPNTLIKAGDSRAECAELDFQDTGLAAIETAVASWDALTDSTASCLLAYLNGAPDWQGWTHPWVTGPQYGYRQWVAQSPTTRQLVLQVDLIPASLQDNNDPLSWERSCDAGHFDSYAKALGHHLIAAGLGHSVIRLGAEANANWETDFIGSTTQDQRAWAKCFDNEVTGFRAARGSHFLIDWNPNACVENIPYDNWYPGNAYVDILGLDFYDDSCTQYGTPISFADLSNEPVSLTHFMAYANAHNKPMSLPEWGLIASNSADDPNYIAGVGAIVDKNNFAFEAYFDAGATGTIELSPSTPGSLAAFQQWFGSGISVSTNPS